MDFVRSVHQETANKTVQIMLFCFALISNAHTLDNNISPTRKMNAIFAERHIGKYTQTYIDCALYFFEPPRKNKKKRTYVCMHACMYVM